MYGFGGRDHQLGYNGELSVLDLGQLTEAGTCSAVWEVPSVSGTPPSARRLHTATIVDGVMHILGGASEVSRRNGSGSPQTRPISGM